MRRLHLHRTVSHGGFRLAGIVLFGLVAALLLATSPAESRPGYPKILNMYLASTVDEQQMQELARWDVLVLDANFPIINPDGLQQLRAMNPDIILVAYIAINGTWANGNTMDPEVLFYDQWYGMEAGNFWLRSVDGTIVSDWPGKGDANLTLNSPTNPQGEQFWEWFARFVYERVWEEGNSEWDGVFFDDVWDDVSWLNSLIESPIDSDQDGVADDPAELNASWEQGNALCLQRFRQLVGPDAIVMSNGANSRHDELNGTMLELFPDNGAPDQDNIYGYAWRKWTYESEYSYFTDLASYNSRPGSYTVINSVWREIDGEPDRTGRYEAHKRLCLGSALLGDGYFSLDGDWDKHGSLWWEPEYDIYLGAPLGPAYQEVNGSVTIWRRDYEAGMVVVNPNNLVSARTDVLPFIGPWDAYIGPPPDLQRPDPVSTASAQALDPTTVRLDWEAVFDPGGSGVASRYDIRYATWPITDGPPWIQSTRVVQDLVPLQPGAAESLTVFGLEPNTTYYFCIRTFDAWGNISAIGVVPSATTPSDGTPGDLTPPAAVADLDTVSVDTTSVGFRWTAVGDDGTIGTAAISHGRYDTQPVTEAGWDQATAVPGLPVPAPAGTVQQATLSGLTPGTTYYLALRAEDEAGNLGSLGNVLVVTTDEPPPPPPPPVDTEGPATVADLTTLQTGETWIQLRFTAPADAAGTVTGYDLRYLEGAVFDTSSWAAAAVAPAPDPGTPGTAVHAVVLGLASGTQYAFRVRSVDETGNWSAASAAAVGLTLTPPPPDTTGPGTVTDLEVVAAGETWLDLSFTAPADDEGHVSAYELRYVAGATFDAAEWDQAETAPAGAPGSPGSAESVRVEDLASGLTYAFRIRAVDDSGNPAVLSDPASGTTDVPPPPPPPPPPADTTAPAAVTDLEAAISDTFDVRLTWTASGDDGQTGRAALYDLRWRGGGLDASTWDEATPVTGLNQPLPAGWGETMIVSGLPLETTIAFAVVVEDSAGNRSAVGNTATIFLHQPEPPDTRPPGAIEDVEVLDRDAGRVTLRWSPGTEPDLSHYRLYRGRLPGGLLVVHQDNLDSCRIEDRRVVPGRSYVYAVTAVDAAGNESAFSQQMEVLVPWDDFDRRPGDHFVIGEPYPNPSAGRVQFSLETAAETVVRMEVFDVSGRRVRLMPARSVPAGDATLSWDGTDDAGRRVGRGIYFLRVSAGGTRFTKKLHVLP